MPKLDPRLQHTCKFHVDPVPEIIPHKPYSKARYYHYSFTVECPRCHKRQIVTVKNINHAWEKIKKFPVLTIFPK